MQINSSNYPISIYPPAQPVREANPQTTAKEAASPASAATAVSATPSLRRTPPPPEAFLQTALRGRTIENFPAGQRAIAAYSAVASTQPQDDDSRRLLGIDLYA